MTRSASAGSSTPQCRTGRHGRSPKPPPAPGWGTGHRLPRSRCGTTFSTAPRNGNCCPWPTRLTCRSLSGARWQKDGSPANTSPATPPAGRPRLEGPIPVSAATTSSARSSPSPTKSAAHPRRWPFPGCGSSPARSSRWSRPEPRNSSATTSPPPTCTSASSTWTASTHSAVPRSGSPGMSCGRRPSSAGSTAPSCPTSTTHAPRPCAAPPPAPRGDRSGGGTVSDRYPAIEDHAVIGDLHTVALVATDRTIDWCCLPQSAAPAVFASLLDADRGGSFSVRCEEAGRTRQLYMPDSNVLVTRFLGTDSVGEVVDFMVPRPPREPLVHPGHLVVRRLRAVRGTVDFKIMCRPAFDFGRQDHAVHAPDHGGAVFTCPGAQAELFLRSDCRFSVAGQAATATVNLAPGEELDLLLDWGGRPEPPAEGEAGRLLDSTMAYWRNWLPPRQ